MEHLRPDGISQCAECMTRFRWLHAPLCLPVAKLGDLLTEMRWEFEEARLRMPDERIRWSEVG